MPTASHGLEPGRNAVHRLLQLCDVLAIALNRFRQLSFRLPIPPDPQFDSERGHLRANYFAVTAAVFPKADIAPQHTAFRLTTDAIAELVRAGSKDEEPVAAAQTWLTAVGWILVPHEYPQWTLSPEAHEPFDREGRTLEQHSRVRAGLLAALARVGSSIPVHVQQRAGLATHAWSPSVAEPVTQVQLLDWLRETEPADIPAHAPVAAAPPPTVLAPPPVGTGQSEGGKPPADAGELLHQFRCDNCNPPHDFSSGVPVCPQCGADARKPREEGYIVPLVTIHFDPPDAVLRGRGQGIMACTGVSWPPGTSVSGETAVVTCPACRETDAFKATESKQHPPPGEQPSEEALRGRFLELHALATSPEHHRVPLATLDEYQCLLMRFGVFKVDGVFVGPPDPTRVPDFAPILNTDWIPIPGAKPLVCPRSSPKLPVELLPQAEARFRSLRLVGPDQTILWVGRQARMDTLCMYRQGCTCFKTSAPPPPDPYAELRVFARDQLKGQERAVIEALCDAGGEMAIADLATKPGVDWSIPKVGFTNAQRRLKKRLKRLGWVLSRHDNTARLRPAKTTAPAKALKTI